MLLIKQILNKFDAQEILGVEYCCRRVDCCQSRVKAAETHLHYLGEPLRHHAIHKTVYPTGHWDRSRSGPYP